MKWSHRANADRARGTIFFFLTGCRAHRNDRGSLAMIDSEVVVKRQMRSLAVSPAWTVWTLAYLRHAFFPKDVSSQGSSEDCWRISHHTYPTHIQHILHIPHISISNVSTTHIPHISSTLHISHTYPFQTYPTHKYPISTYPCNAYPFKRL